MSTKFYFGRLDLIETQQTLGIMMISETVKDLQIPWTQELGRMQSTTMTTTTPLLMQISTILKKMKPSLHATAAQNQVIGITTITAYSIVMTRHRHLSLSISQIPYGLTLNHLQYSAVMSIG